MILCETMDLELYAEWRLMEIEGSWMVYYNENSLIEVQARDISSHPWADIRSHLEKTIHGVGDDPWRWRRPMRLETIHWVGQDPWGLETIHEVGDDPWGWRRSMVLKTIHGVGDDPWGWGRSIGLGTIHGFGDDPWSWRCCLERTVRLIGICWHVDDASMSERSGVMYKMNRRGQKTEPCGT